VGFHEILAQIDREISQLQRARAVLESGVRNTPRKRNLTPEGRRRIVEAVKRRWAMQKKNQAVEAAGDWVRKGSFTTGLAYQSSQL